MESILAQLIEARQRAGLSLAELHKRTLIPLQQLEYLEALEFDKIGPSVYVKGFIRRYAQEVGVDPDSLWQVESYHTPLAAPVRPTRTRTTWRSLSISILRIIAIVAVLALAAVLVYKAVVSLGDPELPPPPDPPIDVPQPEPEPVPPPPEPEPEPTVIIEPVNVDNSEAIYSVHNASELDIVLVFSGKCWTLVTADSIKIVEKTFTAGQEFVVSAKSIARIRFGAPARVSVVVNGVPVETPQVLKGFNLEIQLAIAED